MAAVRSSLAWCVRLCLLAGWLVLGAGILLHLTVRDSVDPLAVVFYGLPLPVLAGLASGLAVCRSQSRSRRVTAGVLALLLLFVWVSRSFHRGGEVAKNPDLTILVWNLSRPDTPSDTLVKLVRDHQPDVVSIVEPGRDAGEHIPWYEEQLPDYTAAWMPRGILWLARVPSRYRSRGKLDDLGAYAWFEVNHPSGVFRFVSVDVYPLPLRPRGPQLDEALAWADHQPHAIIAGDFNTPLESVHFSAYRGSMANAFDVAGHGFRETWFWSLPLLSLDQIWCGPEWRPLGVRKIHTRVSDHAALLATFQRLPAPDSGQAGDQPDKPHP